jgi:hypothetical protein
MAMDDRNNRTLLEVSQLGINLEYGRCKIAEVSVYEFAFVFYLSLPRQSLKS